MVFVRSVFGVPNITGKFQDLCALVLLGGSTTMGTAQGCFATRANHDNACYGFDSGVPKIGNEDGISFDASRSSSVYITNATVRPKAISVLILLRL